MRLLRRFGLTVISANVKRAQEQSDALRKLLATANTGAMAIMLAAAGALASNGVRPSWVVLPLGFFALGLISAAVGHMATEHRSIEREKAGDDSITFPRWKQGITWNAIGLVMLMLGVGTLILALWRVDVPPKELPQPPPACEHVVIEDHRCIETKH